MTGSVSPAASACANVDSVMAWQRPKPRAMLTSRIREEYQEGLDELFRELREDEDFSGIQRYHILEHLLEPLLTPEGRARVKRELKGG